jgi:hypothetical protein
MCAVGCGGEDGLVLEIAAGASEQELALQCPKRNG